MATTFRGRGGGECDQKRGDRQEGWAVTTELSSSTKRVSCSHRHKVMISTQRELGGGGGAAGGGRGERERLGGCCVGESGDPLVCVCVCVCVCGVCVWEREREREREREKRERVKEEEICLFRNPANAYISSHPPLFKDDYATGMHT